MTVNKVYDWVRDGLYFSQVDFGIDTFTLYAMITDAYTPDYSETTITFTSADYVGTAGLAVTLTATAGSEEASMNTATFTGLSTGEEVEAFVLALDARLYDERPYAYLGNGSGLPITFDGGDRVVSGVTFKVLNKA